jgi:hypothetical protein
VVHVDRDRSRVMAAMRRGFPPPPNLASRPLFGLAGIWRPWTGTRGTKAA